MWAAFVNREALGLHSQKELPGGVDQVDQAKEILLCQVQTDQSNLLLVENHLCMLGDQAQLDLPVAQKRCCPMEHVDREAFYVETGNEYRNEFLAGFREGWGGPKEILSRVEYNNIEKDYVR